MELALQVAPVGQSFPFDMQAVYNGCCCRCWAYHFNDPLVRLLEVCQHMLERLESERVEQRGSFLILLLIYLYLVIKIGLLKYDSVISPARPLQDSQIRFVNLTMKIWPTIDNKYLVMIGSSLPIVIRIITIISYLGAFNSDWQTTSFVDIFNFFRLLSYPNFIFIVLNEIIVCIRGDAMRKFDCELVLVV